MLTEVTMPHSFELVRWAQAWAYVVRSARAALVGAGGVALCVAWLPPVLAQAPSSKAQDTYEGWPVLEPSFPSTGGGGIMIGEYRPVVIGALCRTRFTATEPNGTVHRNIVEFDAVATHGGILCENGRWRSADGSASGTTPLRVFIKDGITRGSP